MNNHYTDRIALSQLEQGLTHANQAIERAHRDMSAALAPVGEVVAHLERAHSYLARVTGLLDVWLDDQRRQERVRARVRLKLIILNLVLVPATFVGIVDLVHYAMEFLP